MHFVTAIAAASAEPMSEGLFSLTQGGLEGYVVPTVPTRTALALVLQITFKPNECGKAYALRVILRGPNGDTIFEGANFELSPVTDPHFPDRVVFSFPIIRFTDITFDRFGIYNFLFLHGDAEVGRLDFGIGRSIDTSQGE
jgi:hypothetical protein